MIKKAAAAKWIQYTHKYYINLSSFLTSDCKILYTFTYNIVAKMFFNFLLLNFLVWAAAVVTIAWFDIHIHMNMYYTRWYIQNKTHTHTHVNTYFITSLWLVPLVVVGFMCVILFLCLFFFFIFGIYSLLDFHSLSYTRFTLYLYFFFSLLCTYNGLWIRCILFPFLLFIIIM